MKNTVMFLLSLLVGCISTNAQSNPCASPHALRVGIFNGSPSTYFECDMAERFKPVDHFVEALTRSFNGACVLTGTSVFDDEKNYPVLNGSILVIVSAMPSIKQKGFIAVLVEFSVARGASYFDRMTVVTCPVLLEPEDNAVDLERKASQAFDRYNNMAAGLAKRAKAVK